MKLSKKQKGYLAVLVVALVAFVADRAFLLPASAGADEAAQEHAIRQALQQPGSVATLPTARRPFQPVPLWPHPAPPISAPDKNDAGDGAPERESDKKTEDANSRRKHLAERTMQKGKPTR